MRRAGDPPFRDATARLLFGDVFCAERRRHDAYFVGVSLIPAFPESHHDTAQCEDPNHANDQCQTAVGRRRRRLLCALAPAAAQGQAVSGRVIDATGKAVSGAQVAVAGTGARATTDAEGRYSLTVSAPGAIALRVTAVGFSPQSKALTVAAGQTASVDFTLNANPVGLDAIIVTATGQGQKAREIPNDVSHINLPQQE